MKFNLVFLCIIVFGSNFIVKAYQTSYMEDITQEDIPFQAAVRSDRNICGGALITENFVVTLANCVYQSSSVMVALGFRKYPYDESFRFTPDVQFIPSANIIVHDDFVDDDYNYINDIALIELSSSARLNSIVQPGKLMPSQESYSLKGKFAHISGWLDRYGTNQKLAKVEILSQDTCHHLFHHMFSASQEFCVRWFEKVGVNLLGTPVRVDEKIIGLETITPSCFVHDPSCSDTDKIINFAPFLDWMSDTMQIPVEDFTSKSREFDHDHDLNKTKYLKINDTTLKDKHCDEKLDNLNKTVEQLQKVIIEQNNLVLSLREQIGSIETQIGSMQTISDQNMVNLKEELSAVRAEMSTSLSAQNTSYDYEVRQLIELTQDLQGTVNEHIGKLEKQFKQIGSIQTISDQNMVNLKEELSAVRAEMSTSLSAQNTSCGYEVRQLIEVTQDLQGTVNEHTGKLEKQFKELVNTTALINTTIQNVSIAQNALHIEMEGVRDIQKTDILNEKESLKELQGKLDEVSHIFQTHKSEDHLRCEEIEKVFGEQRNNMDKHVIQEAEQIRLLWGEIKSLNQSVKKINGFLYEEPLLN